MKKPKAVNPVEAAGTMAVSMQQVLNGISELKVSQEDNFSSIKGKLDNHEERLRCLEKATNSQADNGKRERGQRVSCFKCGRPGHIAKYCRGVKGVNKNYSYHCEKEGFGQNTAPRILTVPSVKINNCFISGYLGNRPICYLLDTGADVSVFRQDIWEEAEGCELVPWSGQERLVSASGEPLMVKGARNAVIRLGREEFHHPVIVVDKLPMEALLGLDFIQAHGCVLDPAQGDCFIKSRGVTLPLQQKQKCSESQGSSLNSVQLLTSVTVSIKETVRIPAKHEVQVLGMAHGELQKGTWILEAASSRIKKQIHVANAVVKPEKGVVPVQVLNPGTETITIYAGDIVAQMEHMDTSQALLVGSLKVTEDEQELQIDYLKISGKKKQALWKLIETLTPELTWEQKRQIYALFIKYADVFPEAKSDIGKTTLLQHRINTGGAAPVHQRARRIPVFQRGECQKLVQEMLDRGVIQPSSSPWASPVVLAKKKDGSLRFCVYYRKLNAVTRKDAYALPRIDDTLDALAGSKWFSTLDLASGYWQVGMHPDDREKTAFCTADGLFEFNVMPFGLCNAPATFQRLMDLILAGLQWSACLVYLDDIIIMGKSFEEHLVNLGAVLERLQTAGLKLKPDKCAFLQKRVLYLGHIVSDQGITPDPAKTAKVTSWPIPKCVTELQAFLGLANYYRHFVKGFAEIAKPLHELTRKDIGFQWSSHCDAASRAS